MPVQSIAKRYITKVFAGQMQRIIKKHNPKVIAVAGSVGKTSTKIAIATVLSENFRVQYQTGNYNVPLSVPFIFLGRTLPSLHDPIGWFRAWVAGQRIIFGKFPYDVVVVELSPDEYGQDIEFKEIITPDITVLTAISDEHMEFFRTLDTVAKVEFSIAENCGKLIVGSDDIDQTYIDSYTKNLAQPVLKYGFNKPVDCLIQGESIASGKKVGFIFTDSRTVHAETNVIAKHGLKSLAAAAIVGKELGLNDEQIASGVAKFKPFAGRMQLLKGIKSSTIIDDSYNASPLAVAAALETLYAIEAPQRIALLGNMNELGDTSKVSHESIGALCDPKRLDLVVTLGPDSNDFTAMVAESLGCTVLRAKSPYEAGGMIADNLKDGGVILVKGSQNGVYSEEAIKELLADPSDVTLLVRQSDSWLTKKRNQFADAV